MLDPLPAKSGPLGGVLMRGAAWMIGMRWAVRGLALVNTIVLARLLAPTDFGLVALAATIVALGTLLTDFGVDTALIQNAKAERRHFDTAWTIRILQSAAVAGFVLLLADRAGDFYDDRRVAEILHLLAIGIFVRGFENIGIVKFRKDLLFNKDFSLQVSVKFVVVTIGIALAFYFRDFRSLVYAQLIGQFINVGASYYASAYRPRLSLAALREIWAFSQWVLVRGVAQYIVKNVDVLMLGRFGTVAMVGFYRIGRDVSEAPGNDIVMPISRALFPGFAKLQHEPARLAAAVRRSLAAVTLITAPIAFGLSAVAPELIPTLIGEKWLEAIPVAQIMALAALLSAVKSATGNAIVALGHVRWAALVWWTQAIFLTTLAYPAFILGGIAGMAVARIAMECAGAVMVWQLLIKVTSIRSRDFLDAVWPPVMAASIMYGAVILVADAVGGGLLEILALKVAVGVIVYSGVILLIWYARGRPGGPEQLAADSLTGAIGRFTSKVRTP
jgi:lipopolysaccharide exporter